MLSLATSPSDLPTGSETTEALLRTAAAYSGQHGGCHDIDHVKRVHRLALHIGGQLHARSAIVSAAAILHDIGRKQEMEQQGRVCHAIIGAQLAPAILRQHGFGEEAIDAIVHCIASHRFRDNQQPESLEAKILFDADKLDSIGATGIGRAFLFAGQVGARLHNPECDIAHTRAYSAEDTAYREFMVKLAKIKDRMLTPVGRQLALERHHFMELFFERLTREVSGSFS